MKEQEKIVSRWIDDLIKSGFMHGWGGDRSEEFKKRQLDCMMRVLGGDINIIGGNYRLLATIYSDHSNLKQYCSWKEGELNSLLGLFGFTDIRHVIAMMNCDKERRDKYMCNGKLREGVEFILTPTF